MDIDFNNMTPSQRNKLAEILARSDDSDNDFPPRNKLTVVPATKSNSFRNEVDYDYLSEQVRELELDKLDFVNEDYDYVKTKIDKQKVYFWIRVYLNEEMNIEPGENINIKYSVSGETLSTKFICYSKSGTATNSEEDGISQFNAEDDKRVLCLMVDEEKINYDSEDIPFIRTLFRIGRFFDFALLKRNDLVLTTETTNETLEYYDIEF
jgi:hypothetical protein